VGSRFVTAPQERTLEVSMNIDRDSIWTLKNFINRNSRDCQQSELDELYNIVSELETYVYTPKARTNDEIIYPHHLKGSSAKG